MKMLRSVLSGLHMTGCRYGMGSSTLLPVRSRDRDMMSTFKEHLLKNADSIGRIAIIIRE